MRNWKNLLCFLISSFILLISSVPVYGGDGFIGRDFSCAPVADNSYRCSLSYDNRLGENARIIFVFDPYASQDLVVGEGSGTASVDFSCPPSKAGGAYWVSWVAYRESEWALSEPIDPVARSSQIQTQRIICKGEDCPPVADFIWEPDPPREGQPIQFIDQSYDPDNVIGYRAFAWDDGSGQVIYDMKKAIHMFASAGTYRVTLTLWNKSKTKSWQTTKYITVLPPELWLTLWEPGVEGYTITIDGGGNWGPDPLKWDWGDGSITYGWFPGTHTYSEPGTYVISVTACTVTRECITKTRLVTIIATYTILQAVAAHSGNPLIIEEADYLWAKGLYEGRQPVPGTDYQKIDDATWREIEGYYRSGRPITERLPIRVWTDKSVYHAGELITIHYSLSEPLSTYLSITGPDGQPVDAGWANIDKQPGTYTYYPPYANLYPLGKRTITLKGVVRQAGTKVREVEATSTFEIIAAEKAKLTGTISSPIWVPEPWITFELTITEILQQPSPILSKGAKVEVRALGYWPEAYKQFSEGDEVEIYGIIAARRPDDYYIYVDTAYQDYVRLLKKAAEWTIMLYLNGDNNLEEFLVNMVNEIEKVGSTPNVNFIALLDRHPEFDSTDGNWTDTRLYYIITDTDSSKINSPFTEMGELNLGSYSTLLNFIKNTAASYPAKHYALIIADHGYGWRGVSFDFEGQGMKATPDTLSMHELKEALASSGIHIDLLIFDACLMAMIEVAYQVKDYVNFMIASEAERSYMSLPKKVLGWNVFPYEHIFTKLVKDPDMSDKALTELFVDEFRKFYRLALNPVTISAVDLSRMEMLANSIDQLAQLLMEKINVYRPRIESVRESTWEFTTIYKQFTWPPIELIPTGYLDLGRFLENLENSISDTKVAAKAKAVAQQLEAAIISKWDNAVYPHSGLSIYFPKRDTYLEPNYEYISYRDLDFLTSHKWNAFLWQYYNQDKVGKRSLIEIVASHFGDSLLIEDEDIAWAIKLWINGTEIPETDGQIISDEDILRLVEIWISGRSVGASLAKTVFEDPTLKEIKYYPTFVGNSIKFNVKGAGIAETSIEIFNLAGYKIYDSGFVTGNTLEWNFINNKTVANDVYLYIVTIKSTDGKIFRSRISKLVILR